jgi:bacterioferritin
MFVIDPKEPGDNRMNPSGADMADTNQELIDGLNEDLSAEYQAVVMYRTYASLVSGPYRQELRSFFEMEIPDELGHAGFLADKIVALGGTPTTTVPPVPPAHDNRQMLELALAAEVETIERYTKRIDQAEAAGEIAVKIQLEDLIVDESKHRDDIRRMLTDWR